MDELHEKQYGRGQQNIDAAIRHELDRSGIGGTISVGYRQHHSQPPEATFEITVEGQTVEQRFGYEDIVDSWERLTPGAAIKVRALVANLRR